MHFQQLFPKSLPGVVQLIKGWIGWNGITIGKLSTTIKKLYLYISIYFQYLKSVSLFY